MRPGFKFRLRVFFFPHSVTNRRLVFKVHVSPVHAYSTWNLRKLSLWKVSTDSMISTAMKEHTVRGRSTLKNVKRFRNGSVCKPYERQFTNEHFEWIYQESCYTKGAINRGHQLFNLIKSIFRSVIVFFRGALGYTRNRKTEEKFIQNRKTANKIGQLKTENRIQNCIPKQVQIGKKDRKNQKPHWAPKLKNR